MGGGRQNMGYGGLWETSLAYLIKVIIVITSPDWIWGQILNQNVQNGRAAAKVTAPFTTLRVCTRVSEETVRR